MSDRRLYYDENNEFHEEVLLPAVEATDRHDDVEFIPLGENEYPTPPAAREDDVAAHDTPAFVYREADEVVERWDHVPEDCMDHEQYRRVAFERVEAGKPVPKDLMAEFWDLKEAEA